MGISSAILCTELVCTCRAEFFGQCMDGFWFTQHGWVQSYGSRYVRPPIIHDTIKRSAPMTIREFKVAQALTSRPVKGMLTGPITIMNWSFGRADAPRALSVLELGAAIRGEVADLEAAGCRAIQVPTNPSVTPGSSHRLIVVPDRRPVTLGWCGRADDESGTDRCRCNAASPSPPTGYHVTCQQTTAVDRLSSEIDTMRRGIGTQLPHQHICCIKRAIPAVWLAPQADIAALACRWMILLSVRVCH